MVNLQLSNYLIFKVNQHFFDLITILPSPTSARSQALFVISGDYYRRIQWRTLMNGKLELRKTSTKVIKGAVTHSFVISVRGGNMITFIDDTQLSTVPLTVPPGNYTLSFGLNFMGLIDEVGVYSTPIFNPPGNTLNDNTRCINTCPTRKVCVNYLNGFSCL